jgi:hypothetical protein
VTKSADASMLEGGDIVICSEYGRVEVIDSDDDQVRLQIRWDGFGEGAENPGVAARRVIEETEVEAHLTAHDGQLMVRVWHPRLGFSIPGSQPAWLSIRLQLPARGAYRVRTEAFHGPVAIRRLTLAAATLRGAVGEKLKGIPGFLFGTELDNVELAGKIDIDNIAGLPGLRAPAPAPMLVHAAPITVKARVAATSELRAVTGRDINIAIQPAPSVGVQASGSADTGTVRIGEDLQGPVSEDKPIRVVIHAVSRRGNVHIASVPNAPLAAKPVSPPPGR